MSLKDYSQAMKRFLFLEAAIVFLAFCVEGRLVYLQVFKHADYRRMAYHQQFRSVVAVAPRGFIEDRSGGLLAVNIDLYDVTAHPNLIKDKARVAAVLSKALGVPYGSILSKISGDKPFVWLAREVPYERSEAVESLNLEDLEGIETSRVQHRFYPDHTMASQALGFAGMDNQGLSGIEKYYDTALAGKNGPVTTERDALGRAVLADNGQVKNGVGVVTTIDQTIQHIAQVELEKAFVKFRCKAASIVVMEPKTGEVRAMANFPTFDPNHYEASPKEVWKNRAVNDEFEPGSTFKLIAAVGALEEGIVNEDDKFFCENGAYRTSYGRVVTDHEKHGWLTFREVFGYSSNIGMVKLSMKLGAPNLYRYAKKFGIGDLTGIDLPGEANGKLRPLDDWSGLSLTTIPYGYEVSTTPVQMLAAYGAIANGGVLMRPYIVKALVRPDGAVIKEFGPKKIRRVCSTKTDKRITEMMKWVVEKGTGVAVALPSYSIAGKTGTAYKFMNGHYSRSNYVSSFIGFVPADDPKFVIYVSLDDPRGIYWGGYTAGPVFKEVAKRALAYTMVPPADSQAATMADLRTVPSFAGLTRSQCEWLAEESGLDLKFSGKGERVVGQSQKPGSPLVPPDGKTLKVALSMGDAEVPLANKSVMPELRGKTKRQALALLAPLGVKVNFKGQGVVRAQFPPAGRAVLNSGACSLDCDIPVTKAGPAPGRGGDS